MTCAQGLLRLFWGGPEVGVLRDCLQRHNLKNSVASRHAADKIVRLLTKQEVDFMQIDGRKSKNYH